jgi:hypothetical protein
LNYARFVAGNASHTESEAKCGQTDSHWISFTLNYRWLSIGVDTYNFANNPLTQVQNDSSSNLLRSTFSAWSTAGCRVRKR